MRYRRNQQAGGRYFFTLVTFQRQKILTLPDNVERLREAFRREKERSAFSLDAIVLLPDHLHCMWTLPIEDADFSSKWARIKRYFSVACISEARPLSASRQAKREKAVWQRRFWEHTIKDDADWRRHMDYIHYNPVKHGLATAPIHWPHSSFRQCVNKGWYDKDWGTTEPDQIKHMHLE